MVFIVFYVLHFMHIVCFLAESFDCFANLWFYFDEKTGPPEIKAEGTRH